MLRTSLADLVRRPPVAAAPTTTIREAAELMAADAANMRPQIGLIYQQYAARCFRAGAMDFDDLLLNTVKLFRQFPEVLAELEQKLWE